jgi:hypothetical protein
VRGNGDVEPFFAKGMSANVVHHHGMILQEGDVLEANQSSYDPNASDIFLHVSGRYNH